MEEPHSFRRGVFAQSFERNWFFRGVADQIVELAQMRIAVRVVDERVLKTMCLLY